MFGINSLCRNKKGQGALEYLLIIGGAILVAVIVIMVIVSMGSTSRSTANETANQSKTITSTTLSSIPTIISIEPDNSSCLNNVGGNFTLNWLPQSQAGVYTISVKDSLGSDLNVISLSTGTSNLNTSVLSDTINLAIGSNNCSDTFKVKIEAAKDNQVVESIPSNFNWSTVYSNMIIYYDFNEGSGLTIYDKSGNSYNGTVTGATSPEFWVGGLYKGRFDNVDTSLATSITSNTTLSSGFSVSVWVYPRSIGETSGYWSGGKIVDKSTGNDGHNGFSIMMSGTAYPNRIRTNINNNTGVLSAPSSVPYNQWTHVVVTITSTGYVTNYINGVISGTPATSGSLSGITTTNLLTIGNRSTATNATFDGYIGDLRIYNQALSSSAVVALYNATSGNYT